MHKGDEVSLLGVAIGGGRVVATVYDIEGRPLGVGKGVYTADHPGAHRVETSMDAVWSELKRAVAEAVAHVSDPVGAMSLAVESEAVVCVDRNGRVLAPSILPGDARTEDVARDFQEKISPIEVMRRTGMPTGSDYVLLKLLWTKKHQREVYANAWKLMGWQEYLVNRLGLEPTTDYSLAGRTQMFDIINRVWADEIIDQVGLDPAKLSDVKAAGTLLGEISRKTSEEVGLPAGTKFVLGGYEQAVAALGAGAVSGGHALSATDDAEVLVVAFHEPVVEPGMMKNGFCCSPHVVAETFVSVAYNFTAGGLLRWYEEVLGQGKGTTGSAPGKEWLESMLEEMDDAPADLLVLPYFRASGTPYRDPKPLGAIVGLTLETGRGKILGGLLEGLAFEMRLNAELLGESGIRLGEIHVAGLSASSRKWCQLKANVFGLPVDRHAGVDAATLGAAMLAGMGTGVYENATAAVEFCVHADEKIQPNGEMSDVYAKDFARYRQLYPALRNVMP